jgi:transcriptional regulator with XRE-family HTH domain
MFSAARIQAIRKSKGFSQEVLAEQSGVSLRTIQRVEQGETVPRGHTLHALATALAVPLEALRAEPETVVMQVADSEPEPEVARQLPAPEVAPPLRSDLEFIQLLNLSALSFLVLPLLNIVVPLLLWRKRCHSIEHVAEVGRRILGFQILWQVGSFFAFMLLLLVQLTVARHYHLELPGAYVILMGVTYLLNVLTIGYYAVRLRQGRLDVYPIGL